MHENLFEVKLNVHVLKYHSFILCNLILTKLIYNEMQIRILKPTPLHKIKHGHKAQAAAMMKLNNFPGDKVKFNATVDNQLVIYIIIHSFKLLHFRIFFF